MLILPKGKTALQALSKHKRFNLVHNHFLAWGRISLVLGFLFFAPYLWYGWQAELEEMKRHPNKNYFTLS